MKRWIKNFNTTVSLPEAVSALQHTAGHLETIYLSFFFFYSSLRNIEGLLFQRRGGKKARLLRALYKSRLMLFKRTITNGADVLLAKINEETEQLESQPGTVQQSFTTARCSRCLIKNGPAAFIHKFNGGWKAAFWQTPVCVETSPEFDPAMKKTWLTVSSISLVWAAEMQKRALDSMIGVAGKPTTTVPMFLFIISRPKALKTTRDESEKLQTLPPPMAWWVWTLNTLQFRCRKQS